MERKQRPPAEPSNPVEPSPGPRVPDVERPDVEELLKRMKKVDPDQAKRYRQRAGE